VATAARPLSRESAVRLERLVLGAALAGKGLNLLHLAAPAGTALLFGAEAVFALLHFEPLAPLFRRRAAGEPRADVGFMRAFTTARFFATELALIGVACSCTEIVGGRGLPRAVPAVHGLFHALYLCLAHAFPAWSVRQNVLRIERGRLRAWRWTSWRDFRRAVWAHLLNALNFADFALHLTYAGLFAAALPHSWASAVGGSLLSAAAYRALLREGGGGRAATGGERDELGLPLQEGEVRAAGKRFLVTGGTSGIGREAVVEILEGGGEVVLVSRRLGVAFLEEMGEHIAAGKLQCVECDLRDLHAVCRCSESIALQGKPIDVLLANAGTSTWGRMGITETGIEENLAVNYVGHVALVDSLLQQAGVLDANCRIVLVASAGCRWSYRTGPRLSDLSEPKEGGWTPLRAYGASKLAMVLYARALARQLAEAGHALSVVSIHPGVAPTNLQRHMGPLGRLLNFASATLLRRTPRAAARRMLEVATQRHGLNGHFYDCARGKVRAGPSPGAATEAGDLVLLSSTRAAIQRITGRPQITL